MPTYVRSFDDFAPPARFDSVAFTIARIQESADGATWATIESIALEADVDPSEPQLRDLTTDQATLEAGYYRILWDDAAGAQFASGVVRFPSTSAAGLGYFTVEEARKLDSLADEGEHPDADIEAARSAAEEALEHACGVAFVPRDATEALSSDGGRNLLLRWPKARTVTSVEFDGEPTEFDGAVTAGGLYLEGGWPRGVGNITVEYSHGYDAPPYRVKRAALLLTEYFLVGSGINDRATRVAAGEESMWMAPYDPFGIREVDAVVKDYRFPTVA